MAVTLKGPIITTKQISPNGYVNHDPPGFLTYTLGSTNMAMENGPFEDVFPIENGCFQK